MLQIKELRTKYGAIHALRVGLGLTLIYAAIGMLNNPQAWIGFVPQWVGSILDIHTFLILHSIFELALGVALILGLGLTWSSILATLDMLAILVFYGIDDITFRDFGLFMMAVALFLSVRESHTIRGE